MVNLSLLEMARGAGFKTREDQLRAQTSNAATGQSFAGMDIVETGIMPEGWIGLRTDKGVMCVGPKGSIWVPAYESPLHLRET